MKRAVASLVFLFIGCVSHPKFVDGTSISLGAYVPWQSNLYGVELLSYVNGVVVKTPTNMSYEVTRTHSASNDWCWGMMKSVEASKTEVKILKQ